MNKVFGFFLTLVLLGNSVYPKDTTRVISNTYENSIIEKINNDIKEIRRDQLNYQIEKNLLKETYSSNFTTVQIIISLILGLFAILGYLGLKGIISLKKEYDQELTKIRELKSDFETRLGELTASQEKVKGQLSSIDALNEEQNKKIKLLEIKEKVASWYSQKAYQRALEYIAVGLELAADDIELLTMRAFSFLSLKNYAEALEAHLKVLAIDPTNQSIIVNLAELYLVTGQLENYKKLLSEKSAFITSHSEGLLAFLEVFRLFLEGNYQQMKEMIASFVNKNDFSLTKNYMEGWDLSDFQHAISLKPDNPEKALLSSFANYLKGILQGLQIKSLLGS
jgi:tetratricopeptide (TPR) repeat protein